MIIGWWNVQVFVNDDRCLTHIQLLSTRKKVSCPADTASELRLRQLSRYSRRATRFSGPDWLNKPAPACDWLTIKLPDCDWSNASSSRPEYPPSHQTEREARFPRHRNTKLDFRARLGGDPIFPCWKRLVATQNDSLGGGGMGKRWGYLLNVCRHRQTDRQAYAWPTFTTRPTGNPASVM